jgi:hypothetical protein
MAVAPVGTFVIVGLIYAVKQQHGYGRREEECGDSQPDVIVPKGIIGESLTVKEFHRL